MTEIRTTTSSTWSTTQAAVLAAISLLLGVCGGWMLRQSLAPHLIETPQASIASAPGDAPTASVPTNFNPAPLVPTPEELKQAADSQAAPLVAQLKTDPVNVSLLVQLGNLYYDAKQYPAAIDYYQRSLKLQPFDTSVRTDLGTAYWYKGDPDSAIAEFNKALAIAPTKADTLFNLGIVKWQGKKDAEGAVAAWQKLLDTNPGYPNKEAVLQLIAQVQAH